MKPYFEIENHMITCPDLLPVQELEERLGRLKNEQDALDNAIEAVENYNEVCANVTYSAKAFLEDSEDRMVELMAEIEIYRGDIIRQGGRLE